MRQSLNEAFKNTGDALARIRPTVTAAEVPTEFLAALRRYLAHAKRQ